MAQRAKPKKGKKAPMPKWRPAPRQLVERFEKSMGALTGGELRKMFGYPAGFRNGNMFAGVFQSSLFVRLPEDERANILSQPGAVPFNHMPGRVMKEYVVLHKAVVASESALEQWLAKGLAYAERLPPKNR